MKIDPSKLADKVDKTKKGISRKREITSNFNEVLTKSITPVKTESITSINKPGQIGEISLNTDLNHTELIKSHFVSSVENLLDAMENYSEKLGDKSYPLGQLSRYIDDITEKKEIMVSYLHDMAKVDNDLYSIGQNTALAALDEINRFHLRS